MERSRCLPTRLLFRERVAGEFVFEFVQRLRDIDDLLRLILGELVILPVTEVSDKLMARSALGTLRSAR